MFHKQCKENIFRKETPSFRNHRIMEYAALEETSKDHRVQFLVLQSTIPKSYIPHVGEKSKEFPSSVVSITYL